MIIIIIIIIIIISTILMIITVDVCEQLSSSSKTFKQEGVYRGWNIADNSGPVNVRLGSSCSIRWTLNFEVSP